MEPQSKTMMPCSGDRMPVGAFSDGQRTLTGICAQVRSHDEVPKRCLQIKATPHCFSIPCGPSLKTIPLNGRYKNATQALVPQHLWPLYPCRACVVNDLGTASTKDYFRNL